MSLVVVRHPEEQLDPQRTWCDEEKVLVLEELRTLRDSLRLALLRNELLEGRDTRGEMIQKENEKLREENEKLRAMAAQPLIAWDTTDINTDTTRIVSSPLIPPSITGVTERPLVDNYVTSTTDVLESLR